MSALVRQRLSFRGTIQGVGFRPTVFRVALQLGLTGYVRNMRSEVVVEIQGGPELVAAFPARLMESLPPAARIDSSTVASMDLVPDDPPFVIRPSGESSYSFPPIPPDLSLCDDCARELLDPANRRYLYPFITCTQCGPRYSIVERTPFDRENTTMRAFTQCPECGSEYSDPADRRFHSQTNSCPRCGPHLECRDALGRAVAGDPLRVAIRALHNGAIVALQGIGGFHLAAWPSRQAAIEKLRLSKERERKPFALMVRDLEVARQLCTLSAQDEEALLSAESPIVIAPRVPAEASQAAGAQAEGAHTKGAQGRPDHLEGVSHTGTLGIMLPYTPLHLLLFRHPLEQIEYSHLIMTSGNRAGEPIVTDPAEAMGRLAEVADLFLYHDRRIAFRADDSIVRTDAASLRVLMRRSRGYVPRLVRLARPIDGAVLGMGGDLKSAPALARGDAVHLLPYLGDLDDPETFDLLDRQIRQVLDLYQVKPDTVVHDMHPLYRSTQWALQHGDAPRIEVQHHFAHILSVMAEHALEEVIGLAFDGTGYGTDGTIWGGEFLHATRSSFQRLGSFHPFGLPGGEEAVLHPVRIAASLLYPGGAASPEELVRQLPALDWGTAALVLAILRKQLNCPLSSSLGRVFDAAAAALGLVDRVTYEGEGPILLEGKALLWRARGEPRAGTQTHSLDALLPFLAPGEGQGLFAIDAAPLIRFLAEERQTGGQVEELALLFHDALALAALEGARRMRDHTGISRLALSGGVFQNVLLRSLLVPHLIKDGFEVFLNERVPPGDGGISLGQVYFRGL